MPDFNDENGMVMIYDDVYLRIKELNNIAV
jgi:hypothetical protein